MFGISAAPEIYQHAIQQVLHGLPGVKNISDGVIVFGKDKSEHDKNLHGVLGRLQGRGLTLNSGKCMFGAPDITFFGFDISARGIPQTISQSRLFVMPQLPQVPQRFAVSWGSPVFFGDLFPIFPSLLTPSLSSLVKPCNGDGPPPISPRLTNSRQC